MKKFLYISILLITIQLQSQTEYQTNLTILTNISSTKVEIKQASTIIDSINQKYNDALETYNTKLERYNTQTNQINDKLATIGDALIGLGQMKTGEWNKSIDDATKGFSDTTKTAYINQRKKLEKAFSSLYLKDLGFQKPTLNKNASDQTAETNQYLENIKTSTKLLQKNKGDLTKQLNAIKKPELPKAPK